MKTKNAALITLAGISWLLDPMASAQQARFKDVTEVTVVEVPVVVTVKGAPLRTLTRDDFEILDGRKPQEIIGFEMVDLSTSSDLDPQQVPVAARRHFVAFFDLSFSRPDSIKLARKAAADLVMSKLHPSDLVAVATYSQAKGPQLVLGFTADRNQIRVAIETLGLVSPIEVVRDPLGLVLGEIDADLGRPIDAATGAGGDRGGIGDMIVQQTRDLAVLQGRVTRDQQKNQVLALTSSLETVAQMMAAVEGRKHVLFLSEGFDSSVLVGIQGVTSEDQERVQELTRAAEEGETWRVDSEERYGSGQAQSGMNRMLEMFRQADCTIQAIEIGRMVAGAPNANTDGLLMMAKDTGGELYTNFTDLGQAMSTMLERNSVTYLLAFQPKDLKYDGQYHRLKVRLRNDTRGAEIVHRPGYYPPKAYGAMSPLERRLRAAHAVVGGEAGGEIETAILAAAFEVSGGKAYVPVLVEVGGQSLVAGMKEGVAPLEIYAYAMDEQGTVRDFFNRKIGLDAAQAGPTFKQTGFKYWGHLDLNPGRYAVRVLVRNDATGKEGLAVAEVVVPESGGDGVLSAPLFPEAQGAWVLGREEEAEQRKGVPFPFLQDGEPFIPAAAPRGEPGRAAPFNLVAYNLGDGARSAACSVLDAVGQPVTGGCEVALADGAKGRPGQARLQGTFTPGRLAKGDYLLLVTIKNAGNGNEHQSSIPLRVS